LALRATMVLSSSTVRRLETSYDLHRPLL
jgi:hypothetical protein